MIKIAMNGGISKDMNPHVPTTTEEYAKEIEWFLKHGVRHFHIHFRDADGRESLEQSVIEPQFNELKERFPDAFIGIGSPLENGMTAAKREQTVSAWTWRPDYISLNVAEEGSDRLSAILKEKQIPVEYGLVTMEDAETFVNKGYISSSCRILIEVSEESDEASVRTAEKILDFLHGLYPDAEYLLHGEYGYTWALIDHARKNGLSWRIGLEDTEYLKNGKQAGSNIELFNDVFR